MRDKALVVAVGLGSVLFLFCLAYLLFVIPDPHRMIELPVPTATTTQVSTVSEGSMVDAVNLPLTVGEFSHLIPFTLGRISLLGSIADTAQEREQGLSYTSEIPIGVAKVFIFETSELWSIWMKDMNYPIDIFWLDENGRVIYIIPSATPNSYPLTSFTPPAPARFVIETRAGFAKENNIHLGASAGMTQIMMGR